MAADLDRVYRIFPKLEKRRRQDVATLSGGEKQMVAIGRALMAKPKLLMIDELSLGLAPVIVKVLTDALIELNAGGDMTIILVDECFGPISSAVAKILFLSQGRVQAIRAPDDTHRQLLLYAGASARLFGAGPDVGHNNRGDFIRERCISKASFSRRYVARRVGGA